MKSIKYKLLLGIILINSMMLIGIGIFILNFKDVYINYMSEELNNFGEEVKSYLNDGMDENTYDKIDDLSEEKNINLEIYDKNGYLVFGNKFMQGKKGHMRNMCSITNEHYVNKNLTSYVIMEKSDNIEFLSTMTNARNNDYTIVTKTPISSIESSIKITSTYLFIIFIPIIIISVLMAIWFSNKFTKPIRKLNEATDKIAKLDFDGKVEIKTDDEIEKLGNSINVLSSKINSTLNNLQEKNKELEILINNKIKQEKLRKEFVSSVSHELKTPITVINGYAQGLKSNIAQSEEDKEFYIDVIYEESKKMGLLVKDLLDLYKLESKSFSIKKERINMKKLILEVVTNFDIKFKEENINLDLKLENEYINLDKIRIQQVLNNFIDNAIFYTDSKKFIRISMIKENNKLRVSVYNSGKNIDDEDLENIWSAFVRVDKTRTSSDNRIGLGLSIVKEIVKLHDGEYGVLNKPNGVEFYFEVNI